MALTRSLLNVKRCIMNTMLKSMILVLALIATPAFAEKAATSQTQEQVTFLEKQDETTWTATTLTGSKVTSPAGYAVGTINDLVVRGDGTVSAVVINVGGILGVGSWHTAVGRVLSLDPRLADLRKVMKRTPLGSDPQARGSPPCGLLMV